MALKDALGKFVYSNLAEAATRLLIEMFHKCTNDSSKQRVLQMFSRLNSSIPCIVATTALGVSLDIPYIELVNRLPKIRYTCIILARCRAVCER